MTIELAQSKLDELENEILHQDALIFTLTDTLNSAIIALTDVTNQSKKIRRMFNQLDVAEVKEK